MTVYDGIVPDSNPSDTITVSVRSGPTPKAAAGPTTTTANTVIANRIELMERLITNDLSLGCRECRR